MAILSQANTFSKNQTGFNSLPANAALEGEIIIASGATQNFSQQLDQLQARDVGAGEPIAAYAQVNPAVVAGVTGGTSMDFQVVGADDAALATNVVVLADSGVIPVANLTPGALIPLGFLKAGVNKRFLGARAICVGNFGANAGPIMIGLIDRDARPQAYVQPSGSPVGHSL